MSYVISCPHFPREQVGYVCVCVCYVCVQGHVYVCGCVLHKEADKSKQKQIRVMERTGLGWDIHQF